jgi:hypothetical protein
VCLWRKYISVEVYFSCRVLCTLSGSGPYQVYPGPCKKSQFLPRFISPEPPFPVRWTDFVPTGIGGGTIQPSSGKINLGRSLLFLQGPVYTIRIRTLPNVPGTPARKVNLYRDLFSPSGGQISYWTVAPIRHTHCYSPHAQQEREREREKEREREIETESENDTCTMRGVDTHDMSWEVISVVFTPEKIM